MQFTAHLDANGLGKAVEVFSTTGGFECHGMPLAAAFNPAFTVTSQGTMLAFAEGRLGSSHDDAPKTVLVNRSNDMGRTWEGMRALTHPACHFGPRPYLLQKDGKENVCVLVSFSRYHLKQQYPDESQWVDLLGINAAELHPQSVSIVVRLISEDDGHSWETDALIGDRDPLPVPAPGGQWVGFVDFTGTVETISGGPYAGRRIVSVLALGMERMSATPPNSMRNFDRKMGSSILYSDDGEHWQLGGVLCDGRGNEAAATPAGPEHHIVMMRRPNGFSMEDLARYDRIIGYRLLHWSMDGGQTWSAPIFPEGLPCLRQGGRRYDHQCLPSLCTAGQTLLTATPTGINPETRNVARTHGIIGFSDDLGLTWQHKLIDAGEFSYATMRPVGNEGWIVMFSRGTHGERGSFLRAFTPDWLRKA